MSAEVKEAFELYDEAGEGFISVKDAANVIRAFGFNPTEHELQVCLNDCLRQLKLSWKMAIAEVSSGSGKLSLGDVSNVLGRMKKADYAAQVREVTNCLVLPLIRSRHSKSLIKRVKVGIMISDAWALRRFDRCCGNQAHSLQSGRANDRRRGEFLPSHLIETVLIILFFSLFLLDLSALSQSVLRTLFHLCIWKLMLPRFIILIPISEI